jgi:hypothetical protein
LEDETSLYARLKMIPGEFDIGMAINCWMDHLDVATQASGRADIGEHKDEFPPCLFAAMAFRRFDPGSPYYMRDDTPRSVTAAVIRNFAQRIEVLWARTR